MKHLENLELSIWYKSEIYRWEFMLNQWKAEDLLCLSQLWTDTPLFCCAMMVPSLHTITLYGSRDTKTLPSLLDALEGCPTLTTIHRLYFDTCPLHRQGHLTLDRIVSLPNLRYLELLSLIPTIYIFLSCLSFPCTTEINMIVSSGINPDEFMLPSILPHHISSLHTSPTIDRLYIHSQPQPHPTDPPQSCVSTIGFVQGVRRLQAGPVFQLCRASHFLQFLDISKRVRLLSYMIRLIVHDHTRSHS